MKSIGECLAFYLKYPREMEKLDDEEGELEGLEDPEGTKKMAKLVGDTARTEAADFLLECGKFIKERFSKIGNRKIFQRDCLENKAYVKKAWSISYAIWPANKYQPPGEKWKMKVGVDLKEVEAAKFEVVPWIWRAGGESSENYLKFHLKDRVKATSKDLDDWDEGQVALARIPLVFEPIEGFSRIFEDVRMAFEQVSKEDLDNLYP